MLRGSVLTVLSLMPVFAMLQAERPARAQDKPQYPVAVAVSPAGEIYVADKNLPGIWKIQDGQAQVYFQGEKRFGTPLNAIRCLGFDKQGRLLAGDSATREVYRFDEQAKPVPLTSGGIGMPMSIAVAEQGDILVSDVEVHGIWRVPPDGGEPHLVARLEAPTGMAMDQQGRLVVVSRGPKQLVRAHADGSTQTLLDKRVFAFPNDIVLDASQQNAYIADGYAKAIWKLPVGEQIGEPSKWVEGEPFQNPVGLAWQGENLLVVDSRAGTVFSVNPQGEVSNLLP